jgi:phytanoyl-CoA dioxygenase PhyH
MDRSGLGQGAKSAAGRLHKETLVPATFDLSRQQLDEFERHGALRLPGFYPKRDIDRMANRLWADLAVRYGMQRDRPESWTVPSPTGFQALKRSGAFALLGSPRLFGLADLLLGAGAWQKPVHWGIPLVTFPTPEPGQPRPAWHLDISGSERLDPLPILRVFTFLEPAPPRGGGTLYVAGSHRLAFDFERDDGRMVRSAQVCARLRAAHPWFGRLLATPTAELPGMIDVAAMVATYPVRLEEMTGEPGDLIVMHPAIVHAAAHNAGDRPRLMLTEWIPRRA